MVNLCGPRKKGYIISLPNVSRGAVDKLLIRASMRGKRVFILVKGASVNQNAHVNDLSISGSTIEPSLV